MTRHWLSVSISLVAIFIVMTVYACVPEEPKAEEVLYQNVPLDKHLLELDKKALELAYQDHVKLLFSVWLKDDISVVHRINTGLRRGREAYSQAAARIEEREKRLLP